MKCNTSYLQEFLSFRHLDMNYIKPHDIRWLKVFPTTPPAKKNHYEQNYFCFHSSALSFKSGQVTAPDSIVGISYCIFKVCRRIDNPTSFNGLMVTTIRGAAAPDEREAVPEDRFDGRDKARPSRLVQTRPRQSAALPCGPRWRAGRRHGR